ncbi:Pre-mRNA-splicing factor CWC21 [Spathaspora sp. JA1]|nr:Pre-mRNA-splicing factor CWC21 [Spathaspora sp. JA1]
MSYNGIGLPTARGSGTSGYVQKNLAGSNKKKSGYYESRRNQLNKSESTSKGKLIIEQINKKQARLEIVRHDNLRTIEVKCSELRDKLEDVDMEEEEIIKRIDELREKLSSESSTTDEVGTEKVKAIHQGKKSIDKDNKDKDATTATKEYIPRYPKERRTARETIGEK